MCIRDRPRSQDLPDIAALNFAINIIERDVMIENKNVVGVKMCIRDRASAIWVHPVCRCSSGPW